MSHDLLMDSTVITPYTDDQYISRTFSDAEFQMHNTTIIFPFEWYDTGIIEISYF